MFPPIRIDQDEGDKNPEIGVTGRRSEKLRYARFAGALTVTMGSIHSLEQFQVHLE